MMKCFYNITGDTFRNVMIKWTGDNVECAGDSITASQYNTFLDLQIDYIDYDEYRYVAFGRLSTNDIDYVYIGGSKDLTCIKTLPNNWVIYIKESAMPIGLVQIDNVGNVFVFAVN